MKLKQPGRSTTPVRIILIIHTIFIHIIICIPTVSIRMVFIRMVSIHMASIRMVFIRMVSIRMVSIRMASIHTTIIICMGIIFTIMPVGCKILGLAIGTSTEERLRDNKGRSALGRPPFVLFDSFRVATLKPRWNIDIKNPPPVQLLRVCIRLLC
ncbi:hypothetical protein NLX71_18570 [Paenibacillus sp. MZ04-78.2]|uniref:hypothetical protein n=1 Tax=Paenibacillus sp. MZ04-78.2 TaxID=2962034 RepID=UPI0020B852F2|nr:hypothetical protein [Paenibacillus sp. MZ04-78.2]MCP3775279.1 hypothetical protein [Paenibacillus sp. MZ04-78.2]